MSKRTFYLRYSLIIRRVKKAPATFSQISEFISREAALQDFTIEITKRTFQRDLDEIRSLFNVDIQYDFSRRVYAIAEESHDETSHRMLEAFDLFNALNITDDISNYVYFENRKPNGADHFHGLLHAARNHLIVRYAYLKYEDAEVSTRVAEPYGLKEFKGRWYLIAKDQKDSIVKTFGLDRMQNLEITRKRFESPGYFNAHAMFKNCFGIINSREARVEEIILSFQPFQGKYIKSFPLHESQQVLVDNDKEVQIGLSLYVTHDLVMELLSYGETLEVKRPIVLRKLIKETAEKIVENSD